METSFTTLLGFLLLSVAASVFFSAAETAYVAVSRHQLKAAAARNKYLAKLAHKLLNHPDRLLSFILLGNNLANVGMTTLVAVFTIRYFGENFVLVSSLLTTFFILIFCEITPKSIAYRHPYTLTIGSAWLLYPLKALFLPVIVLLSHMVEILKRLILLGKKEKSNGINIAELKGAVVDARALLSVKQSDMLLNILDFHAARVEEAMTALGHVEACDLSQPLPRIKKTLNKAKHSHLLVFMDNINEPLGFLDVRQVKIMFNQAKFTKEKLQSLVLEAPFVPVTVNLLNQLEDFLESKSHHAIVVDEYGVPQGMITLKDIISQITGMLEASSIREIDPHTWLVADSIPLRTLNNRLGLDLKSGQAKTLRGLILEKLEELPRSPVCIAWNEFQITIENEKSGSQRQRWVRICKIPSAPASEDSA